MVKTYIVSAPVETHSAIASFLVAEVYKFAFANGKFMVDVHDNEESNERFNAFLTFFVAEAKEYTTAGDTPKDATVVDKAEPTVGT